MTKENFYFINEGNGIEGLVPKAQIDKEESTKHLVVFSKKSPDMVWDPIFECFVPKTIDTNYTLEKGTVPVKRK